MDEKPAAAGAKRKGVASSMRTVFMHGDWVDTVLMTLGLVGSVGDGLTTPFTLFILGSIMNHLGSTIRLNDLDHSFTATINKTIRLLCYLAVSAWCLCFTEGYCWTRTAERQVSRMRARYLKAVLRQDVTYFDLHVTSTSEVITCVSKDSLVIQDCISEKVPHFVMNMSTFLGSYLVAFLMLWRLAVVGFPFVVLLVIPGLMYGRILMSLARKLVVEYNKAGTVVEQALSSIRTVYAFVGEKQTTLAFSLALEGSFKLGLKQGLAKGLAIGSNGVTFAIWGFYCWYGGRLVIHHDAKGGNVFAVGAALSAGGLALGSGLSNVRYLSEAASAAERIMEVINRVPEIDSESTKGKILENVIGEVEFRNVEFSYPSRPETLIFQDFCLKVPAKKVVALVGGSGSGKSTVISLLQRFYDPLKGEILVDGVAVGKLQLKWLRSQMGLVSQEPALFATSIKENILFGKEDATMEEVIDAAKASNAHNFITQLPQGYDTQVGERGMQMSGGQKQRIAIARAIIRKPRILLLDEATSALDSKSEHAVQAALDSAAQGRTSIIIAHRLSTIRHADLIAVVLEGQVAESGSHDELINVPNGLYASLTRLQQEESTTNAMLQSASSIPHRDNISVMSRSSSANSVIDTDHLAVPSKTEYMAPSFRRLLAMNSPEWKQAFVGFVSAALFGAVQPLYSYMMGSTVSVYFLSSEEITKKTTFYSFFFLGLFVFSFAINVVQHYSFAYIGECLTRRVREKMLSKLLTFEVGWFDQDENSTGSLCSRLAKDADVVRSLVGDRTALLVQTISAVTIATIMGLVIAWKLAIVMLAVQPLVISCFYTRRVLLKSMSKRSVKSQDGSTKLAADGVSNIRIVTSFSSQSRILRMLASAQEIPRRDNIRLSWYTALGLSTSQSLLTLARAVDFWFGGKLVSSGDISAKELFQTFMILHRTGVAIADAGSRTTDLAKGSDAVGSVFAILDRVTKIEPDSREGSKPDEITGHVTLLDVDFAYPARPDVMIFKSFTLDFQARKSTALVGHSGSGKSTIIGLIERFYDPVRGSVKIDGKDIRSYNLRSLRKYVALVSQEPTLFAGTVKENIAYGAGEDVDEAEIIEAAKAAYAHDFISSLKDGYNTWCGHQGLQLSGGQKQRIAIARAILRNPGLLLLDEATSALDIQSEKVVQDALERVMIGRTSIVVAHRLSTIQNCDMIAVLDKGKVVEKGTHEGLIGMGPAGAYYSLVNLQRTVTYP